MGEEKKLEKELRELVVERKNRILEELQANLRASRASQISRDSSANLAYPTETSSDWELEPNEQVFGDMVRSLKDSSFLRQANPESKLRTPISNSFQYKAKLKELTTEYSKAKAELKTAGEKHAEKILDLQKAINAT